LEQKTLGVISGTTSLLSRPVIDVCESLEVPLFLAVATDDGLLNTRSEGLVFRLPPQNTTQVQAIVNALEKYTKVAILYETNQYGISLYRGLKHAMRPTLTVYAFALSTDSEVGELLPVVRSYSVDTIVYLGYSERATDLLSKLKAEPPVPVKAQDKTDANADRSKLLVILSDGSYSTDLLPITKGAPFSVELVFPARLDGFTSQSLPQDDQRQAKDPCINEERNAAENGFAVFGSCGIEQLVQLQTSLSHEQFWGTQTPLQKVLPGFGSMGNNDNAVYRILIPGSEKSKKQ
jgi:hypothetical protein